MSYQQHLLHTSYCVVLALNVFNVVVKILILQFLKSKETFLIGFFMYLSRATYILEIVLNKLLFYLLFSKGLEWIADTYFQDKIT